MEGVHKILYGGCTQNIVWRVYIKYCMEGVHKILYRGHIYLQRTQTFVQRAYTENCMEGVHKILYRGYIYRCTQKIVWRRQRGVHKILYRGEKKMKEKRLQSLYHSGHLLSLARQQQALPSNCAQVTIATPRQQTKRQAEEKGMEESNVGWTPRR